MQNLKQLREQIKTKLNKEQVADLLTYIGYEVTRDFKFKLRQGERTASASIRADGFLKDFGGDGWSGDIVALLHEHHKQSLKDAMEYVASCLGIHYE